jgi:UDPglucose 6-dehydrogenase
MPLDINATDFLKNLKFSEATVGLVGHGFVGKAVAAFFKDACHVLIHDKIKPELQTLKEVVSGSEVIFVCVPTPMRQDGSCYTGFVEEVLQQIRDTAKTLNRNLDSFVVVIKSTVYPGFTEEMRAKYLPLRLTFSPEFLTEANSIQDFKNTNRIIVGGDEEDAVVVCKYFHDADPSKLELDDLWKRRLILQTDSTTAEMVKLYANGILTAKIMFSNEIYQICQKLGVEYSEVRTLAILDHRIGAGHTTVPGPDGQLGYGGHCFPKDVQNLRAVARSMNLNEKIFTAMIERNDELREKKDWLEMKDRAVTEN